MTTVTNKVETQYIEGLSFNEYLTKLSDEHPDLRNLLDDDLIQADNIQPYIDEMRKISWEFEAAAEGGRGDNYNIAQRALNNRKIGMTQLLKLFQTHWSRDEPLVLDALAGDGTVARFAAQYGLDHLKIISADLAAFMVELCLEQNLPCIRQSATRSLFSDDTLDGVLVAYGSHHIPHENRKNAAREAYRTLRAGGRFVLHDFETGGGTANWFEKVVHPYSRTGHPHPHFSRGEMFTLMSNAGFRDIRVFDMDDSFTLTGATSQEAKDNALRHLYYMYDLVKISNSENDALPRVEACARETFGDIQIEYKQDHYAATIPRIALVGVGTKLEKLDEAHIQDVLGAGEQCAA